MNKKFLNFTKLKKPHWPWSKLNIYEYANKALNNKIVLPNIGEFDLGENPDWIIKDSTAINSRNLWLNSIQFIHCLLECFIQTNNSTYIIKAKYLFDSYFDSIDKKGPHSSLAWSDEHAVSNRLFVLVALLHASANEVFIGEISEERLISLVKLHANWLLEDKNYVKNNHGVMMDIALIHASTLLSELFSTETDLWLKKAIDRSSQMLKCTFDDQGLCTENSPSYHYVNYALFTSLHHFLNDHEIFIPNSKYWHELLSKAKNVGNLLIRQDGKLPLIGDTESLVGCYFPFESINIYPSVGYYPDSGLYVYKNNDIYFTLRAGGSSFSHRHVDDSSITLFYKGLDFIVDSGLYSYDGTDKIRRWFTSPLAHSGFYLESANKARYINFNEPSAIGGLKDHLTTDFGFEISAYHNLSPEALVDRSVKMEGNSIHILDKFECEIPCSWTQRFIIHPNCKIEFIKKNNNARIINNGIAIELNINSDEFKFEIENVNFSDKFLTKQSSLALVVKGVNSFLNISTYIKLL